MFPYFGTATVMLWRQGQCSGNAIVLEPGQSWNKGRGLEDS